MTVSTTPQTTSSSGSLHSVFLSLLPRLQVHAEISFRDVRCPETRADKVAETVALAWVRLVRLHERGKDVMEFPMAFISLVARAVKCGRRATGQEKVKDALSPLAQRRHGFKVGSLDSSGFSSGDVLYSHPHAQEMLDTFEERLQDNTQTPVPDQVVFRVDWPQFFGTLTERDRKLAEFLSLGHSGKAAAQKFNVSPGRVTQLRQQWLNEWRGCQQEV